MKQKGQSLMETIGAIFILSMALSTAIGVAIYAFSRSNLSEKQVIATNLAREGVDVVRMMRDTNWLSDDVFNGLDSDCGSSPPNGQSANAENPMNGRACYTDWLGARHYITPENADNYYILWLEMGDPQVWYLSGVSDNKDYHVCKGISGYPQWYGHSVQCRNNPNPPFSRRIRITEASTSAPYTPLNPLLLVESAVIWSDKNCPPIVGVNPFNASVSRCRIIASEYLTNWKDYQ